MHQQLSGRLGNQLFQWAFAHQLALNYSQKVTLFTDKYHIPNPKDDLSSWPLNCEHLNHLENNDIFGKLLIIQDKLNSKLSLSSINTLFATLGTLRTFDSYAIPSLPTKQPRLVSGFLLIDYLW